MALQVGDKAPPLELPSTSGETVSLASFRGRKVVLFFYPKNHTPGCTQEACDFRDRHEAILDTGAVIFGISKDSIESHHRFREKQELPYPLLSDPDNAVSTAYGAFGMKKMYGKEVQGTIRSTFVINEEGMIEAVWSPVRVKGHAEKVLEHLKGAAEG